MADILTEVASYYSEKLAQFGETPRGVDWNGEESQALRFEQLSKILTRVEDGGSINDLGCGYGAYFEYLEKRRIHLNYTGIDVSEDMVAAARRRHGGAENPRFVCAALPDQVSDYGVASGIFNVRLGRSDADWLAYLQATLDVLDRTSSMGFAFNCLTSYSDADKMRDYLYYADPCAVFDYCKRRYSRHVALLHDYGLHEFTILVRKQL